MADEKTGKKPSDQGGGGAEKALMPGKRAVVRDSCFTHASMTAPGTTSTQVGNGSPAGAAARWCILRKVAQLSLRNRTTTLGVRTIPLDFATKRRNVPH